MGEWVVPRSYGIRRALAQSVSDHRLLERDNKQKRLQLLVFFVSDSINKIKTKIRYGFRNHPFQDNGSEMDSEMSTCSGFLLRPLFLVQKTAHARGAVREPRAMVIVTCLSLGGHPFFKHFFGTLFSLKIMIFEENGSPNRPKMKTLGSIFSEKV